MRSPPPPPPPLSPATSPSPTLSRCSRLAQIRFSLALCQPSLSVTIEEGAVAGGGWGYARAVHAPVSLPFSICNSGNVPFKPPVRLKLTVSSSRFCFRLLASSSYPSNRVFFLLSPSPSSAPPLFCSPPFSPSPPLPSNVSMPVRSSVGADRIFLCSSHSRRSSPKSSCCWAGVRGVSSPLLPLADLLAYLSLAILIATRLESLSSPLPSVALASSSFFFFSFRLGAATLTPLAWLPALAKLPPPTPPILSLPLADCARISIDPSFCLILLSAPFDSRSLPITGTPAHCSRGRRKSSSTEAPRKVFISASTPFFSHHICSSSKSLITPAYSWRAAVRSISGLASSSGRLQS
mmetsp:Transcript_20266/g.51799  ORF Transcript_20266/g.51799 Transcript_20266/m.51799 type:complete len:351 (-) Transcript_20266:441-1493(-)